MKIRDLVNFSFTLKTFTKSSTLVFLLSEQVVLSKQGGFFMKFAETSRLY